MTDDKLRQLSRSETHDLSMIIKDRTKVLKAHVEHERSARMAEFEKKLAAIYTFDQDDVWKAATERARAVVEQANDEIGKRCEELGIPRTFAPSIHATWQGRGENALRERRTELRTLAKASIEAMARAAIVNIEKQSLDLRTQVVAMGLLSPDAKLFLESLAPVEEAMCALSFEEIEAKLDAGKDKRRLGYDRGDLA